MLSIISVVYVHVSSGLSADPSVIPDIQSFCRFCVPAFIILFAYFTELSSRSSEGWYYHASRIRSLLIPFFFWSVLYFLIQADWSRLTPSSLLTTHFSGFGWAGQYFFILLFQIILLFPFLQKLAGNELTTYGIIFATLPLFIWLGYFPETLPSTLHKLSLRPVPYWFAYVIIGILSARRKIPAIPAWTLLFVLLLPLENHLLTTTGIKSDPYIRPGVFLGSAIITLTFLSKTRFGIASIPWVRQTVEFIAPHTMGIFVLNPLFTLAIRSPRNPFAPAFAEFPPLVLSFILVLIVLLACLVTTLLIKRLHCGWMLGKS
jgi:surface polysaccharide O-acyltransferase-like enzyme